MNIIVWLGVGALVGGLASGILHVRGARHVLLNVVIGAGGSLIGGILISLLEGAVGISTTGLSAGGLFVCLGCASILLALVGRFEPAGRRNRHRYPNRELDPAHHQLDPTAQ